MQTAQWFFAVAGVAMVGVVVLSWWIGFAYRAVWSGVVFSYFLLWALGTLMLAFGDAPWWAVTLTLVLQVIGCVAVAVAGMVFLVWTYREWWLRPVSVVMAFVIAAADRSPPDFRRSHTLLITTVDKLAKIPA